MAVTNGFVSVEPLLEDLGKMNLKGIHWVIVGGESGPKARAAFEKVKVANKDLLKVWNK
jgi:protein gp37